MKVHRCEDDAMYLAIHAYTFHQCTCLQYQYMQVQNHEMNFNMQSSMILQGMIIGPGCMVDYAPELTYYSIVLSKLSTMLLKSPIIPIIMHTTDLQ